MAANKQVGPSKRVSWNGAWVVKLLRKQVGQNLSFTSHETCTIWERIKSENHKR